MDYSFVRLPYTLWYNGKDKKIRMDLNSLIPDEHYENGKKYIGKIRNVQIISCNSLGNVMLPVKDNAPLGPEELTEVIYNEEKRYADIILKSYQEYNNDGELVLGVSFDAYVGLEEYISDYSYRQRTLDIVIPIRSHNNLANGTNDVYYIGVQTIDIMLRNGKTKHEEDSVDFSFELIEQDITDNFITNGQARDLLRNESVKNVDLRADSSGLNITVNYNKRANVSWEDLKPYLGSNSNSNEYVTTTLEDILSMLRNTDESIRHEFTNDIIEYMPIDVIENDDKDIVVQYMPNYVNTQREHITERRDLFTIPRRFLEITDKEILKNEITESIQPALDKKYYTKQEVDTLINNLRKELKPDS